MDGDTLKEGHIVDKGDNHDFNWGLVGFEPHSNQEKYQVYGWYANYEVRVVVRCRDF